MTDVARTAERATASASLRTVSVAVAVVSVSATLLHLYLSVCVCEQSIISVQMENKNHKYVNGAENGRRVRVGFFSSICANKVLGALSTCANY